MRRTFVIELAVTALAVPGIAEAAVYTVCPSSCSYATIGAALQSKAVSDGDVLELKNGATYVESAALITKSVTIRPQSSTGTKPIITASARATLTVSNGKDLRLEYVEVGNTAAASADYPEVLLGKASGLTATGVTFRAHATTSQAAAIQDLAGGSLTLTDCKFGVMTNSAASFGGAAIHAEDADIVLTRIDATAGGSTLGYGGFLYMYGGQLTIADSDFQLWSAASGGAISQFGATGKTVISGTSFAFNDAFATYGGGALRIGDGGAYLEDVAFTSNEALVGPGGAIAIGSTSLGTSGIVVITGGSFTSNLASAGGGGIYAINGSSVAADETTFTKNDGLIGGAIYAADSEVVVANAIFNGNIAHYVAPDDTLVGGGGAIMVDAQNTALRAPLVGIVSSAFIGNKASADGGALLLAGALARTTIDDSRFTGNTAARDGGAAYLFPIDGTGRPAGATPFLRDRFAGNVATRFGGAILYYGDRSVTDTLEISDGSIESSDAAQGGGLWVDEAETLTIRRETMCDNESKTSGGGGIYAGPFNGPSAITNTFFVENKAATRGGGIQSFDPDIALYNNHFIRNEAAPFYGAGARYEATDPGFTVRSSLVGLSPAGDGVSIAALAGAVVTYNGFWANTANPYTANGVSQPLVINNFAFTTPPVFVNYPGTDPIGNATGCAGYDLRILSATPTYVDKGDPSVNGKDLDGTTADLGGFGGKYADPTWWADADKDNFRWVYDCDDTNASIRPTGKEVCNGLDDNCNGKIDDGAAAGSWYADADNDGFGDTSKTSVQCTRPVGYVGTPGDCNDADKLVSPSAVEACNGKDDDCDKATDEAGSVGEIVWHLDSDADKYGDPGLTKTQCAAPGGYVADGTDCNDKASKVYPTAPEYCNGVSDDCDTAIDENAVDAVMFYADVDADTQGDPLSTLSSCKSAVPVGYVTSKTDCNDADKNVYAGAIETCNAVDDDCDGKADDGFAFVDYTRDTDGDGYGFGTAINACKAPTGYVAPGNDCDDKNPTINPGTPEVCNTKDDNCSGTADEGLPTSSYYPDTDRDGQGDKSATATKYCAAPPGTVADNRDCNDRVNTIYVGAPEACNNLDDDCDGAVDDDVVITTFYADSDGDGYGGTASVSACKAPAGYVTRTGDCTDTNSSINPGALEKCGNGVDDDCTGKQDDNAVDASVWYADSDGDSFGDGGSSTKACGTTAPADHVANAADCDDTKSSVRDGVNYYRDGDADGFGDASATSYVCKQPSGFVPDSKDCNDSDKAINPSAGERCATLGVDDDCDGAFDGDDASPVDVTTYYSDADNDGYGPLSGGTTTKACTQPALHASQTGDCDDKNPQIRPTAPEQCDGVDNDCDGTKDDGIAIVPWWPDADKDGFGDIATAKTPIVLCKAPMGYIDNFLDCNDSKSSGATVNPRAPELCNAQDDDCDGQVDEGASDPAPWYEDLDGDGFGTQGDVLISCDQPPGYTSVDGDCNDELPYANPEADEVCDAVDDDCDGQIDEQLPTEPVYTDADGDGWGAGEPAASCTDPSEGQSASGGDCDDVNELANPEATEVWYDGVDGDCNGASDYDQDADGYDWIDAGGSDCDDENGAIHPDVVDNDGDGVDSDCGGTDGVDVPEIDTGREITDSGETDDDTEDTGPVDRKCGCQGAPPVAVGWLVGLAALLRRRPRRP